MSIQKNINQLLGIGAAAIKMAGTSGESYESKLGRIEGQVHELGKYDPESQKFKGSRKEIRRISESGLYSEYKKLLQQGVAEGKKNPAEVSEILNTLEGKFAPTESELARKEALKINAARKAKIISEQSWQTKARSQLSQKEKLNELKKSLAKDETFPALGKKTQDYIISEMLKEKK